MSYSQYPSATPQGETPTPQKKDNRNLIYGLLVGALVLTWGYLIYDKNKSGEKIAASTSQIAKDSLDQSLLKAKFDVLSDKADSITVNNQQLQGALAEKNNDIQKLRSNISKILSDRNASKEQLAKAQEMIKELNGKIDDLGAQVEKLSAENKQLTASNEQLNTDKTQLATEKAAVQDNLTKTQQEKAHVEDLASTLHASNINIEGVQLKGGGTEKETDKAKHVNYFKVSFNIDENRISPSGTKQFYVIVYNPDGTPSTPAGNFTTRDNGDKPYTNKVEVNYEQGKLTPVSFTWKPGDKFQTGDYKVEIYNNGFKIGEGKKTLKKSGFLGL